MGNQLAAHSATHKQIDELQNACVEAPLGGGRLLQTMLYKHDVGKLVVKVYNKQGESLDLKPYKQQLKNIHDRLKCLTRPHVWPFQEFVETENTGFMIRPFIFQNLYDRMCSRPFLSHIEKCWITYQLLEALVQCHSLGVCHGDIKSENVLVTSWNWVFLADFASYKPTYLPADNPADFSYFFDLSGERRCYVAPERFVDESVLKTKLCGELTPAMDVFSLGCVIAELFMDYARGMFIFSELHRYKKGQFDPKERLTKLDPHVQELVLHMIQLDPSSRLTSSEYLTRFTPSIFPLYFNKTLAPFFGSLLFEDTDTKLALLKSQFGVLMEQIRNPSADEKSAFEDESENPGIQKRLSSVLSARDVVYNPENNSGCPYVSADSCGTELMDRIEELEKHLATAMKQFSEIDVHATTPHCRDISPQRRVSSLSAWGHVTETDPDVQSDQSAQRPVESESHADGKLLILVLLCSLVRGPKIIESKRAAITLLAEISECLSAECCLNRMVPYFLAMLSDSTASVRALALHLLLKMLSSIRRSSIQNYERRLYQDYILPSLSLLPNDPEELVRVEYAAGVPELTACACDYLQKEIAAQMGNGSVAQQKHARDLTTLRELIVKVIHELISGERSSAATRCALSTAVSKLAQFYGSRKTPDLLLLLTTFTNDANDKVKFSFFQCLHDIDAKSLGKSLKILQPFLEIGVKNKDDTVLTAALSLTTHVCVAVNRKKEFVLGMARMVAPLVTHRSSAVRAKVIEFLAAVAQVLTPADAFARLLPLMKGTLPQDPGILDSEEIIAEALWTEDSSLRSSAASRGSAGETFNPLRTTLLTQHDAENERLFPKTASYSTHVNLRLIQSGFSRHRASLEVVSMSDATTKQLNSRRERDIRSRSALMTHELSRHSVKHGNLDDGASRSFAQSHSHPQYRAAVHDALGSGMDARSVSRMMDAWKPEGILLAHYVEHRRCVNQIAINRDHSNPFFVTASNDGTVKVWDLKHIEDDLSFRSCATYAAQKGEILSVTACEDRHSIASASSHGTIHVWRVNYAPQSRNGSTVDQFTGISAQREVSPDEGAILHVQQWDALLLYTSQRGIIHAWDTRMKNDAWTIRVDPKEGLVRHLVTDPLNGGTWIVTGSSQGVLDLWDVRFKLRVAQWRHPTKNPVVAVAPMCGSQDQLRSMNIKSQGPFVYLAAGGNEVGLWDIQEQSCKQVFRAISREETEVKKMELPSALGSLPESRRDEGTSGAPTDFADCVHQLKRSPSLPEGIRTVLPIGEGCIVTGGCDKYIRVWDGVEPKHSFPMCGPTPQNPYSASQGTVGSYDFQYSRHFERGVPVIDECCLPSHFQRSTQNSLNSSQNSSHVDCITDLGMARVHERMLISSSRDGIVKIWK